VFLNQDFIVKDKIESREYQVNIAVSAEKKNTLVVLPTGLGKTVIAMMLISKKLINKKSKMLFLAPTKPLVLQHAAFLNKYLKLNEEQIATFTGEISPKKRKDLWEKCKIIVSTPQVIENDLLSSRYKLNDIALIIYDEAHHAIGKYAYVYINEIYQSQCITPHVLAMTASPGHDLNKILAVCQNLSLNNFEIRTKMDTDVKPYVHDLNITWKHVSIPPEFSYALQQLRKALSQRLKVLKDLEVIESSSVSTITKTKLLDAQKVIQSKIREQINPSKILFNAAAVQSESLKIYYALEILQTQGIQSVRNFLERIIIESKSRSSTKSSKNIAKDTLILDTIAYLKKIKIEHPKLDEIEKILLDQLIKNKSSRIIIFTHYRDTSTMVYNRLCKLDTIKPVRFIGQASKVNDKGLTQKQQSQIISKFRKGEFNVLVATSVAEEGLDIPSTELVVFYEPIPSEIRNIQRRGRTARKMAGKIVILITKNTPDEGYYWASKRREKQMIHELELLRTKLSKTFTSEYFLKENSDQMKIEEYIDDKSLQIVIDHREYRSSITRLISQKKIVVKAKQLEVGDYIVSDRIGVERKKVDDFLNSMISGKLFKQLHRLKQAYSRPMLYLQREILIIMLYLVVLYL
jgi:Fanconi anemia group M protein